MVPGILFLLAGFLLSLAVYVGNNEIRGRMAGWKNLADRVGLRYRGGEIGLSPCLDGAYEGRSSTVRLVLLPTARGDRVHTRVESVVRNASGLSLTACNRTGYVGTAHAEDFGLESFASGDERLDKVFDLAASDAGAARKILDDKIRERLAWEEKLRLEVDGHRVVADVRDAIDDEEHVRLLLDLVGKVASKVENL